MSELWEALVNLFRVAGNQIAANQGWLVPVILLFVWIAWWLWGVNWPRTWARLAEGAWVPFVLLLVTVALVWSQLAPRDRLGTVPVPNFWWQLGAVGLLACIALLCGALQGYFAWTPADIDLEPPVHEHVHEHGAGHDVTHDEAQDHHGAHH